MSTRTWTLEQIRAVCAACGVEALKWAYIQSTLLAAKPEAKTCEHGCEPICTRKNCCTPSCLNPSPDAKEASADQPAQPVKPAPIPMRIPCPECKALHIDEGEFATKPHHTHSCQVCGLTWRPAVEHAVGVRFLPGFKNEEVTRG